MMLRPGTDAMRFVPKAVQPFIEPFMKLFGGPRIAEKEGQIADCKNQEWRRTSREWS